MTDKEKLLQLIETGCQNNIDLGVYGWLAQGFDKTELVNEYRSNHELNLCNGWEPYRVQVGSVIFSAVSSDYSNFKEDRVFSDILLMSGTKVIFTEIVPSSRLEEYAKYYLRKMLDTLEVLLIKIEPNPQKKTKA